jgi:DNA-binding NtrC family response regulator
MSNHTVLIFDQDAHTGSSLRDLVENWGYNPVLTDDTTAALKAISELKPVLILDTDASANSDLAREDFDAPLIPIERPIDPSALHLLVDRAIELELTRRENEYLRRELQDRGAFGELVGNSDSIRKVYTLIEQVAPSSASVLITGESGTGKELVARTIHRMSPRRDRPFVAINCSAIPETLMESELFGHEKGSFTGAASRRQGCFELADTGTLLLDEIGEMPPLLQAKLLRVIEERSVRRLGSRKEIEVDVRLLAATNRYPHQAVEEGKLRSDLLYRLNVFGIHLPSLGERKEDLPLLAQHLVIQLAAKHGRPARFLSSSALEALQYHTWPGNVRELRNVIERAVIICSGEQVERHHFAPYPIEQRERLRNEDTLTVPVGTPLEEVERQMIMRTLQKTKNNKTRAAELLGISLKTLHNKLNLYRERGLMHEE